MPYSIRKSGEGDNIIYEIVDDGSGNVVATRKSEDAAETKLDNLEIRDHLKEFGNRLPAPEMSAEEKAAAYDKMMAEKDKPSTDLPVNQPPAPTSSNIDDKDKDKEKNKEKDKPRSRYWGTLD